MQVGIVSDTHNHWDDRIESFFAPCDVILHAGDIGSLALADRIAAFRPLIAVSGNIDDSATRREYPLTFDGLIGSCHILMLHIGGYPGNYDPRIRGQIYASPPQLFISGHSHILKVKYDKTLNLLHINPGAAGMQGWQKERTLVRLIIEGNRFADCEVITLSDRKNH